MLSCRFSGQEKVEMQAVVGFHAQEAFHKKHRLGASRSLPQGCLRVVSVMCSGVSLFAPASELHVIRLNAGPMHRREELQAWQELGDACERHASAFSCCCRAPSNEIISFCNHRSHEKPRKKASRKKSRPKMGPAIRLFHYLHVFV